MNQNDANIYLSGWANEQTKLYLSRGHLAANSDFAFNAWRATTFVYINAAPQWQTFNGGNWATLEDNVKTLAAQKGDLTIWTGTHEVQNVVWNGNNYGQFWLYDDSGAKKLPVPRFFWKLVYHAASKKAIVVVGVNNPYYKEIVANPCDVQAPANIASVTWLKIDNTDLKKGFIATCTVAEFKRVVTTFTEVFDVSGGLLLN